MLTEIQARDAITKALPGAPIKAWTKYNELFLFRIEHPSKEEKDWDPFFSVNIDTGEVRDFSVITDGNLSEIAELKWITI